jgi:hypothetical protein
VHCTHGPKPFDGRRFFLDFVDALRRFRERGKPWPYFQEPAWQRALRFADERDRSRLATADAKDRAKFVSEANARHDGKDGADYFSSQHTTCLSTAAAAITRDGFNIAHIHRSASGITRAVPQIDTYRAAPNNYDRYKRDFSHGKSRRERIAPQPASASSTPQIIKITLDQSQAAIINPMLDKHRDATKITGLLAALTRSYSPIEGCVTLELQLIEVDRRSLTTLQKIGRR